MYTVDYFIDFFSSIPEQNFRVCPSDGEYNPTLGCALQHLNRNEDPLEIYSSTKSMALAKLLMVLPANNFNGELSGVSRAWLLNDDDKPQEADTSYGRKKSTCRSRMLAALQDVKKMQQEQRINEGNNILNSFNPPIGQELPVKQLV